MSPMKEVKKGVWIAEEDPFPFIKEDLNKKMNEKERETKEAFVKYFSDKISHYRDEIEVLNQKIAFSRELLTEILNEIERK